MRSLKNLVCLSKLTNVTIIYLLKTTFKENLKYKNKA